MLTNEQVKQLRHSMTWGDQAYGKEQAKGDNDLLTKHAMHRAAKRLGLAAPDSPLADFLDIVSMDDLKEALEDEDRSPTSANTAT